MTYTETIERNGKKYYYRIKSMREDGKVVKEKIYLGSNLKKDELSKKEKEADRELDVLSSVLKDDEIKFLEKIKKEYVNEPKENYDSRYRYFTSLFTYDSNAIEGNTLTLQETNQLLFEGITPRKSMREVNETLNHKKAFDHVLAHKADITRNFILSLHDLVVKNTLRKDLEDQTGKYRTVQVYIGGVEWLPPKPEEVPGEMRTLLSWYTRNKKNLHPLVVAAYFHISFEIIHPFVDGNGRVGRLLMNFILHKNGYPMINIPNSIKYKYYDALQNAQIDGNLRPFIELMIELYKDSNVRF